MQWLKRFLRKLKLPWLFLLSGALMLVSWLVPDPLPMVDELLLLVITTMLGSWRNNSKNGNDDQA
jgi:hypothetical protein